MPGGHIGMSGGRICWSVHELGTPWCHRQVRGGTGRSVVAQTCPWWHMHVGGGIGRPGVVSAGPRWHTQFRGSIRSFRTS